MDDPPTWEGGPETTLGNWLTDAMREISGADIAICTKGHFRVGSKMRGAGIRARQALRPCAAALATFTLLGKSKTFPVQRRAGGHPWFFGFPEQGLSQSLMYHNSNMLAWLPARLGVHGHNLTILPLSVGDDLNRGEGLRPDRKPERRRR